MRIDPTLLLILPTGGGKSTLFLLAASLSTSKTTILVVPLVALKANLVDKAKSLGISYTIWEDLEASEVVQRTPALTFVSLETASKSSFLHLITQIRSRIDRVIMDEAHIIPLASNYRHVCNQLTHITRLEIPIVLATATMTQEALRSLQKQLLIPRYHLIQGDINRANISYGVIVIQKPSQASRDIPVFNRKWVIIFIRQVYQFLPSSSKLFTLSIYLSNNY